MTRRAALLAVFAARMLPGDERATLRGRLQPGDTPRLRGADGREWTLEADEASMAVLRDERVQVELFEAVGTLAPPSRFRIDPIHRKAMFVVRGGTPLVITYWCEVCAIRTYSPGKCQCCQEETALDPRAPELEARAR